jgi:hypothetical protein
MSQYDCKIVYVKDELNTVADALSQTSFGTEDCASTYSSTVGEPVSLVSIEGTDALMILNPETQTKHLKCLSSV